MNGNAELLNYIYQNSQMGTETLRQLMDIAEDSEFRSQLQDQFEEYKKINAESKKMLEDRGFDEKGIGSMEKISAYLTINMKTLMNKSSSHIAEMLIQGSNMGIIDAIKNIRKYKEADKDIIKLMEDLLKHEEKNVNDLKSFL